MASVVRKIARPIRAWMLRALRAPTPGQMDPYSEFMYKCVGVPNILGYRTYGISFPDESTYAQEIGKAAYQQSLQLSKDTYDFLTRDKVAGDVVEFGVAHGYWLKVMLDHMEETGDIRTTWGFDSFEGLPEPNPEYDDPYFFKGQYAAAEDRVREYLEAGRRPHLKLVKGWFSDTLPLSESQAIREIAYAKIDCDLYEPAVECLEYLSGRLVDGAVLMFDDWMHRNDKGESKAFMEWAPTVPQYRFELIGYINWRLFFRVWHNR